MIVNHKYKFIFIKTRKTASTSMEIALSKFCGPGDILTKFSDADEEIRRSLGYVGPQNNFFRLKSETQEWKKLISHTPSEFAEKLLGTTIWNSYFKFCFERNPFDKAISRYYWEMRKYPNEKPSLSAFLHAAPTWMLSNWDHYSINDEVALDFVGRYEFIQGDFRHIERQLGLPEKIVMPEYKSKGGYRTNRQHYSELLSGKDRELIERVCGNEIEAFGYSW